MSSVFSNCQTNWTIQRKRWKYLKHFIRLIELSHSNEHFRCATMLRRISFSFGQYFGGCRNRWENWRRHSLCTNEAQNDLSNSIKCDFILNPDFAQLHNRNNEINTYIYGETAELTTDAGGHHRIRARAYVHSFELTVKCLNSFDFKSATAFFSPFIRFHWTGAEMKLGESIADSFHSDIFFQILNLRSICLCRYDCDSFPPWIRRIHKTMI